MAIALIEAGFEHRGKYGSQIALCPLNLAIARGEQVAIIGPSGAGKTTLLHLMATALKPTRGELMLLGSTPWGMRRSQRQELRRQIGLIQQAPPLPPRQRVVTALSAGRLGQWSTWRALLNLTYPLDIEGAKYCLALLDIEDKIFERCDQLSGGQLQRVAIARTLYQQPQLILADEPVAAMDPWLAHHTLEILTRQALQQQATLVVSLHAVDLALRHFDRIIGLRDGDIAFDQPTGDVSEALLAELYANEQFSTYTGAATPTFSASRPPGTGYPCR